MMATFTISIPDDLKKRMDERPDVNWPEYIKGRFKVKLKQLWKFEQMVRNGEIDIDDVKLEDIGV